MFWRQKMMRMHDGVASFFQSFLDLPQPSAQDRPPQDSPPPDSPKFRSFFFPTRQPENSKRAHLRAPAFTKHHQNSTKRPPREGRKKNNCGGRVKKSEIFEPPTLRGPTLRRPHFSGFGPLRLGVLQSLNFSFLAAFEL